MRQTTRILCLGTLSCTGGLWAQNLLAQDAPSAMPGTAQPVAAMPVAASAGRQADEVSTWTPVSDDALDTARGGYDMGSGLVASFGISRAVYVNGDLVTSTSFYVPDIAHITPVQATAMNAAMNSVSLVQIGPNNTFDPSALAGAQAATVIQNTLDHQNIQAITTLNTSVNSLNVFRQMNFQDALQQSQLQSLGH